MAKTWACGKPLFSLSPYTLAANAQRIDTEKADPHKVVRVATAPNHLSVIELAEPVVEVAAGSSSYKIEWRENKVFVQPLDPGATTNLFIWTASGRQSYELVPAQSVQDMQFAIDQEPAPHAAKVVVPENRRKIRRRHRRPNSPPICCSPARPCVSLAKSKATRG